MSMRSNSAGPSMCPNCHAIVSAGEPVCPQCGAAAADRQAVQQRSDHAGSRFINAVMSRPAPFTIIFIVFCVLIYLRMGLTGGADGAELVAYGAQLNGRIQAGEWWRFVTPIFLHVPMGALPLHLLMNMWALWNLGPYVEKLYGSSKFVVIWVVTGIAGSVASYFCFRPNMHIGTIASFLFRSTDVPSAGASGSLFGLIGVLIVFGIKYRHELPEGFKRAFGTGLFPILLINFGIGFWGRGFIENSAHVGGLISGIVVALAINYERPGSPAYMQHFWRLAQGLALALVVVSFFMVWRHYSPPPKQDAISAFMVGINQGQTALIDFMQKSDPGKLDKAEHDLAAVTHISPTADDLVKQLHGLIQRAQAFPPMTPGKPNPPAVEAELVILQRDYDAWAERSDKWLAAEGPTFGLTKDKTDKPGEPPDN